jgi:ribonuclease HI
MPTEILAAISHKDRSTMHDDGVLIIHTDGGSRGNPGPAAFAYTIEQSGKLLVEEAGTLGRMTNNQAEYLGLIHALEHAAQLGQHHALRILSDSELMVKQLNGKYRVKNEDLRPLFIRAMKLKEGFPSVSIKHVPRDQNSHADRLCNEALDGKRCWTLRPAHEPPGEKAHQAAGPAVNHSPLDLEGDAACAESLPESLHDRAIECLRQAASAWSRGDPDDPKPAVVWKQLWNLIQEQPARPDRERGPS